MRWSAWYGRRPRRASRRWAGRALSHAEEAEGAFLLEVQGAAGRGRDPPDPAAQLRDLGPDPGLGQHPETEGQRGRADVQPPLQVQGQRDRGHVLITELAVPRAAARCASRSGPRRASRLAGSGPA
jgi:hypothetical protein